MNIKQTTVPDGLIKALKRQKFNYSEAITIFHCVWLHADHYVGVVGNGDHGAYEWFDWKRGELRCSDSGFGCNATALLRVLAQNASV